MNTVVSVSAETESFFWFRYRFRPKIEMAVSASFGFGRNKKKPFGRPLKTYYVYTAIGNTSISVVRPENCSHPSVNAVSENTDTEYVGFFFEILYYIPIMLCKSFVHFFGIA